MRYGYIYTPVALDEYENALNWYKERSKVASLNFVNEVNEKLSSICNDPTRYRNSYKHFRETSLKKYPYNIIYYIEEANKLIVISSVFHHRRHPKNKYK